MEAIKTDKLTKKYKNLTAVDSLDLLVEQGELFALLGVNGAGKTTTIKMLSCLTKPTGGDAYLNGNSIVSDPAAVKNVIGVSPQETAVAPGLTVKENLALMCGVHGFSKEKRQQKIKELSRQFDLAGVLGKKAGKLSGGWQRRLSIAMALISEPKILFLDEPTLGLDVLARGDLWDVIRTLKGRITIILTSHYMEEVEQICTRIAIMDHGRVIASGTTEELKKMIKTGETITVEAILLEEKHLQDIRNLSHVFDVHYENQILSLRCTGAQHNLIRLLNYLQSQDITFGRVFSELPTLNDVFLEITGKQLRD